PLVQVAQPETDFPVRLDLVEAVLAGPGPMLELTTSGTAARTKPLVIRSLGTVFGRLQGPGVAVASVIASSNTAAPAAEQLDRAGDRNVFAGWRGFLAIGSDRKITIDDLAAVRSTWNGTDAASQEILFAYPQPSDVAAALPTDLVPYLADRAALLGQVAQP